MIDETYEVVCANFKKATLTTIERIQAVKKLKNKADAVVFAVRLTELILDNIAKGNQILIEDRKGNFERIVLEKV